jgi:hypothetical protein
LATATLIQERESVSSAYVAVDWLITASPVILQSILVILRTGSVSNPIEVLLRVSTPTDLNNLPTNPLNMLASSAWQYLYDASLTPASIRFDTIPAPWQTITNTTMFSDTSGALNSLPIPNGATLQITGGYGNYNSGAPLLLPVNANSLSLANIINLAAPYYFPLGPSGEAVTYSIGFASDLPTPYQSVLATQTNGAINYNNTYNILSTYAPVTQITPQFGPGTSGRISPNWFPSVILNIPPPTTNSGMNLSAQNSAAQLTTLSSNIPFLTSTSPFPTNISVWSDADATGSKLSWNSGTTVLTDAVITRSDNGNSTIFLDQIFYSYFQSVNNALSHSISVQQYVESLLNQESQTLLVGGGSLLGVSDYNLSGS